MGTIKVDQIEPRATPDQVTIVSTTLTGTTAGSTTIYECTISPKSITPIVLLLFLTIIL